MASRDPDRLEAVAVKARGLAAGPTRDRACQTPLTRC